MPLSISTVSAPTTSQVRIVPEPARISTGDATNFWTARGSFPPVRLVHAPLTTRRPEARMGATTARRRNIAYSYTTNT
jgi:hypothetical protein